MFQFYRIWAISLVLLALVILWPHDSKKSRRTPVSFDDKVKWLVIRVQDNNLLDKFNRTIGSLEFDCDKLYFNSYTYKLSYNRDTVSIPNECLIHTHSEKSNELLHNCVSKCMQNNTLKLGKAFKRWYGVSIHYSYSSVLDMLDLLDDYLWISTDFDSKGSCYSYRLYRL